jgi:hypothetical protein
MPPYRKTFRGPSRNPFGSRCLQPNKKTNKQNTKLWVRPGNLQAVNTAPFPKQ